MPQYSPTRAEFIDQVLTSRLPGETAKRFSFPMGEVGALYTLGYDTVARVMRPVVLLVATFPPSSQHGGFHDFGIDYRELPVANAEEAAQLLAQFEQVEAAQFRARCRPAA